HHVDLGGVHHKQATEQGIYQQDIDRFDQSLQRYSGAGNGVLLPLFDADEAAAEEALSRYLEVDEISVVCNAQKNGRDHQVEAARGRATGLAPSRLRHEPQPRRPPAAQSSSTTTPEAPAMPYTSMLKPPQQQKSSLLSMPQTTADPHPCSTSRSPAPSSVPTTHLPHCCSDDLSTTACSSQ
ncbi:unnamed protein product, partial [Amoebophrya sp. A25]